MRWVYGQAQCAWFGPLRGQDGYQAQVPQHPIDSYRYISHISTTQIFNYDLGHLMYQFSLVRVASNTKQKKTEYLTVIQ